MTTTRDAVRLSSGETAEEGNSNKELPNCSREDVGSQELDEYFGPALPPQLMAKNEMNKANALEVGSRTENPKDQEFSASNTYGPSIPSSTKNKVIGPAIPAHLLQESSAEDVGTVDSDPDEGYGPSLSLMADPESSMYSLPRKKHKSNDETERAGQHTKRESWMLELPPDRAISCALGPRQFRTKLPNERDSDRSGWTETPGTEKKSHNRTKEDEKAIAQRLIQEKNDEMERLIKKSKKSKKEEKSLLELHRKKLKKKAKKEEKNRQKAGKPVERRPFDRNIDLQVNRFDESQKRAVLKKAQLLNDRFTGGESKFL